MKDTRKLSVVYFVVSLVMLVFVCFGCESQPTEHYILKYEINHEEKSIDVRFGDDFTGNKTITCEQLKETKGLEGYSINIYK